MPSSRTSDLAILLGHVLQCESCRARLLEEPERVIIGRKLTEDQRAKLRNLSPKDLENAEALAGAMGLSVAQLKEGFNHPRARLRHL